VVLLLLVSDVLRQRYNQQAGHKICPHVGFYIN
jgi:hypothetical protein